GASVRSICRDERRISAVVARPSCRHTDAGVIGRIFMIVGILERSEPGLFKGFSASPTRSKLLEAGFLRAQFSLLLVLVLFLLFRLIIRVEVARVEEAGSSERVSLSEAVGLLEEVGLSFTEVGRLLRSEVRVSPSRWVLGYAVKAVLCYQGGFWVVPSR